MDLFSERMLDWPKSCRIMLLQCIANMAVDPENEPMLRRAIPQIVRRTDSTVEMECVVALQVCYFLIKQKKDKLGYLHFKSIIF